MWRRDSCAGVAVTAFRQGAHSFHPPGRKFRLSLNVIHKECARECDLPFASKVVEINPKKLLDYKGSWHYSCERFFLHSTTIKVPVKNLCNGNVDVIVFDAIEKIRNRILVEVQEFFFILREEVFPLRVQVILVFLKIEQRGSRFEWASKPLKSCGSRYGIAT